MNSGSEIHLAKESVLHNLHCLHCCGRLKWGPDRVSCTNCGAEFPVVDGIPILIVEERSVFRFSQFLRRQTTTLQPRSFRSRVLAALPSTTLNLGGPKHWEKLVSLLNARVGRQTVLVVGSGEGGSVPAALAGVRSAEIIYTDVSLAASGIQLICDGHEIPFDSECFDAVIAQAVLEHVADPYRCVEEFYRVLKPEGLVYAETPFMQQGHSEPYDFTRFTRIGHRRLFRRFALISSSPAGGPGTALAWAWQHFLLSCSNDSRVMNALALIVGRCTGGLLKYLDYWLYDRPNSRGAASGYCFLGSKSTTTLSDYDLLKSFESQMS